jgi:hypothetical protein
MLGGVFIKSSASLLKKEDHVICLSVIRRVLPVDVEAVEAEIRQDLNGAACEFGPAFGARGRLNKVGGVSPSTDRKQHLQLAVALLLEEQLLGASIDVGTHVVPRVTCVMLLSIGPTIRQEDLSSISDIGKGIEDMGKFFTGKVLRVEVASINSLQGLSDASLLRLDKWTNPIDKVSNVFVTCCG